MTLEAASAIILLLVASLSLPLFAFPKTSPGDFFLCADAALALSKRDSFSSGLLQDDLNRITSLSGLCIEAESASASFSSCGSASLHAGEVISLPIPSYNGLSASRAQVRCWRGSASP